MRLDTQLLKGTTPLLVLTVINDGELYGYEIAQRIREDSGGAFAPSEGSLYPALHRLENKRFLIAEWKLSDTGRDAKFYRLTKKGRAFMHEETASWHRLTSAVGLILDAAEGEAS